MSFGVLASNSAVRRARSPASKFLTWVLITPQYAAPSAKPAAAVPAVSILCAASMAPWYNGTSMCATMSFSMSVCVAVTVLLSRSLYRSASACCVLMRAMEWP